MANFFRDSALFKNKSKPLFYSQICKSSSNAILSPFISQNSQVLQELDVQASQDLELSLTTAPNNTSDIDKELTNVKMSTPKEKGKFGYKSHFKDLIQNYNDNDEGDDEQDIDNDNEESSLMSDDSSEITDETSVTKNDKVESSIMDEAQNEAEDEDDDIEITDVRKIGYFKKTVEEKENNNDNDNDSDNVNEDNNDNNENDDINETDNINKNSIKKNILFDLNSSKANENSYGESDKASMEYLLNAISLLTKNKRNLEHRLKRSDIISNQVNQKLYKKTEIVNTLKDNVKKLQENLKLSMSELKNFKDRLYSTRKTSDEVSMELKSLKENSLKNHETLNVLKGLVIGLKDQLAANQINITQKSTQIHHLKNKLDDVSGRLSEEKINNSNLIKIIEETRNNYESELYKNSVKQQALLERIINKDDEFKIKWEAFTGSLNDQLKTSDNDSKKILELNSTLAENFQLLDKTLKSNTNSYHVMMDDFGKSNIENLNCLKLELIETASNIDVKSYSKISSLFDEINRYLKNISTSDEYVHISTQINDLIGNIKSKDALETEFKIKNSKLIQEKIAIEKEYHSILENFNKQKHKITEISIKVKLAEELKSKISEENNNLKSELNSARKEFNTTIDRLKNERKELIKSFEGKLKTQNELLKHAEEQNLKSIGNEKEKNESLITRLNETTFLFDKLRKNHDELQKKLEKSTEIAQSSIMELNDLKTFVDKELKNSKGHKNQINFTHQKLDCFTKEKRDLKLVIENKDKIITEMKNKWDVERTSIKSSEKELSSLKVLGTEKQLKIDSLNQLVKDLEYKLDNPAEIQPLRSSTLNKNHLNILNREADKTINKPPITSSESRMMKKSFSKKRKLIDSQDSTKSSQSFKQNKIVTKSQPKFKPKSKPANSAAEIFDIPDIFNEFEAIDRLNPPRLNTIIKK